MRFYFVRFTGSEFTRDGAAWVSPIVDLYNNSTYKNYSTTKSSYGVAGVHTTWIGLRQTAALLGEPSGNYPVEDRVSNIATYPHLFTVDELRNNDWRGYYFRTDTGEVVDGRYIDTSGRIDMVSFSVDGARDLVPSLMVYAAEGSDATYYRDEWASSGPFTPADEIGSVDSPRYARFRLDFPEEPPANFEFLVRVEIDQPVMAPMYRSTRRILDQFPEWMAVRELSNRSDVPELREPESLGGKVINALSGRWLDDIESELIWRDYQRFIATVDLTQMAWAWKSTLPDGVPVWSITGDGVELARAMNLEEFYSSSEDDVCLIEDDVVYVAKKYGVLAVNGAPLPQEPHHTWNYLDELGMVVDLPRLRLEDNATYQLRILDVHRNPGGVGVDTIKKALRRELNLWKYMATPNIVDSNYDGAYPELVEISDIENDPKYFAPDGLPTEDFERLVAKLSREYPTTWGRFRWGKMIWDLGGPNNEGYGILPYRYDVDLVPHVQSGVGDGDDLLVYRPGLETGAHEFTTTLTARGRRRTIVSAEYPGVDVSVEFRAHGTRSIHINPIQNVWFSVIVATAQANYIHSFEMSAQSDVSPTRTTASPDTYDVFELFGPENKTRKGLLFLHPTDPSLNVEEIPVSSIQSVTLRMGRWDGIAYVDEQIGPTFRAWFSMNDTVKLLYNNAPIVLTNDVLDPALFPQPTVVMESLNVGSATVAETWHSEPVPYTLTINGVVPLTTPSPVTVRVPQFSWPTDVSEISRQVDLAIVSTNAGQYGGFTRDENGNEVFLPSSLIYVNADNIWQNGNVKTFATNTTNLTFSTGTSSDPAYPTPVIGWEPFVAAQTVSFDGTVDEHGPWRSGEPSRVGNTSFVLESMYLDRLDFGVPNDTDHVITWIDVSANNDRVIAWLDNNTVHPVLEPEDAYPPSAIRELEGAGLYSFEPFLVYARLRPDTDPSWNPKIHAGYFYRNQDEYYMFAKPKVEIAIDSAMTMLTTVARQGAPIIAYRLAAQESEQLRAFEDRISYLSTYQGDEARQVAFFDHSADPVALSLVNKQTIKGSGINRLFLAYPDVYNVTVHDLTTNQPVAADVATATHELVTAAPTNRAHMYEVTYMLRNSFYADYEYVDATNVMRTRLVFSEAGTYEISYESADYDEAASVDLPLSPLYTIQNEGFIFISYNEYTLAGVRVHLSPSSLIADGKDYLLITLKAVDEHGNPKGNQTFNLSTTFGTLDRATVTTDNDGFAVVILTSANTTDTLTGTLTIAGAVNASVTFGIEPYNAVRDARLLVTPNVDQVQAGSDGKVSLYGKFESFHPTNGWQGLAGKEIRWTKARSIYELFGNPPTTIAGVAPHPPVPMKGTVTTGADGGFRIGPFNISSANEPGYWFVAIEGSTIGLPDAGDVVTWFEYPAPVVSTEDNAGLPVAIVQRTTDQVPWYKNVNAFPTNYDESSPYAPVNLTNNTNWLPPKWFAINKYVQYQMGLLSTAHDSVDFAKYIANQRKYVKDL